MVIKTKSFNFDRFFLTAFLVSVETLFLNKRNRTFVDVKTIVRDNRF